jgi:hypothetical protein
VADEVERPEDERGMPRKSRVRRVLIRSAVAILSLYALYVAAINVFLSTSLFEKVLDQDPETLFISYERGWSVWPGRIQARHLTIRSSDSHVECAHVRGGDVEALGDFVVRGEQQLGAFVVSKGPLSAGVKLDDRGTYVRLFRLEHWRAEQKRAALALFAAPDPNAKADADAKAAEAKTPR